MIQHDPKMIQDDGMTWYDFGMTWYDRQTLRYEPQDVDGSVWILHQGMDIHITGDGHPPIRDENSHCKESLIFVG
jgi:hypothetical protein